MAKVRYVAHSAPVAASRMVYTTDAKANAVLRMASGATRTRYIADEHYDRRDRIVESRFAPSRIDTSQPYAVDAGGAGRDYLGGLQWSPEFERYIKHCLPRQVAEARRLWIEWWRVPYVYGRLAAMLGQRMLDAVLELCKGERHPREVERFHRMTLRTISQARTRAMKLVRRLLPTELYDKPYLLAQALAD